MRCILKFAFVVNNYPPRVGGVEIHVHSLATELVRQGHEAVVLTLGSAPGRRVDEGVEVITLKEHFRIADTLGFPALGTRSKISKILRAKGVNVVSTHTRFFPMSYIGLRAARSQGLPVVHTEHGSDHVASGSLLIRMLSRWVDLTVGRAVLRGANSVLGVSEAVTAFVTRLAGVSARVFYNAIPTPAADPARTKVQPHNFVFVGRIVEGKGWDDFVRGLAALGDTATPFHASIVGDGPDSAQMLELITSLNLTTRVRITGRVQPEEVRNHLRGTTLVNPTVLSEGFQTTLLESIAEGGRVITYPVPGAAVLRQEGAPVNITEEPSLSALASEMHKAAGTPWTPASHQIVQRWTWPGRAQEYVELCEGALTDAGRYER